MFFLSPSEKEQVVALLGTHHSKAIANPQAPPATWALGKDSGLTVNSNDISRNVADHTAANVGNDFIVADGHHGNGGRGREPEGFVIAAGVITHIVDVTEHKRHCVEAL